MADNNWKDKLDPVIRGHLEHQLREVSKVKNAYINAPNSQNAQLWCVIALMSKQVFNLNARLKQAESTIESLTTQLKKTETLPEKKKRGRKPAIKK